MTTLTNSRGGQVVAEGEVLEALKDNGWVEVVQKDASPAPTPAPSKAPRRPRTTAKN